MLVLASDTTGKSLSAALLRDDRLVGEIRLNLGYNHAVTHMPQVLALLKSCEVAVESVDLFACTNGPGSFTGTRIGISSCKAMAYAAKKPAIGVSSLEALAWPWREWPQAVICPLLDARNGRVYAAAYIKAGAAASVTAEVPAQNQSSSELTELVAPGNYLASDFLRNLAATLDTPDATVLLVGDGAAAALLAHAQLDKNTWTWPLIRLNPIHDAPSAAVIAWIATRKFAAGEDHDPFTLQAEYLTASAAERKKADNP